MGVPVTPLYYEDSSATFRMLWNTSCHTDENIKYLAATVADQVRVVHKVAEMFPRESKWEDAGKYMLAVYGKTKRRSISRWLALAKRLPCEVLKWVDERVARKGMKHGIKDTYFYDNPYLGGSTSQAHQQLTASSAVAALEWLGVALDTGSAAARGKSAPFPAALLLGLGSPWAS